MSATDCQGSSASFNHIGCGIWSVRRGKVYPMDAVVDLGEFQKKVAERFEGLAAAGTDDLLSISWVGELLDVFLCCQEEFQLILCDNSSVVGKSPADRLMAEFSERSVKALDVCNAVRDGIERIRQWRKLLEIVLCALDNNNRRSLAEGQFRRAKKALTDLANTLLEEKGSASAPANRNRSFGRNKASLNDNQGRRGHFRSLSWSVSRSWSAAKQLQAIGNNLTAPRATESTATNGLAVAFFTMSSVFLFVMWALVAAIPCQDRGLNVHFSIPRHFSWASPMLSLHERILEESKKRERRNASGLLKEVLEIDRCSRFMNVLVDSVQFPLTEEKETEVRKGVKDLRLVFEAVKEGLDPLERQVREVFHRIVRNRTEGLESLSK